MYETKQVLASKIMDNIFENPLETFLNLKSVTVGNLKRLNLHNVRDLLLHIPSHYVTKKIEPNFNDITKDDFIITTIKIIEIPNFTDKIKKFLGRNHLEQTIELTFFAQIPKFMWAYFKINSTITIQGKVSLFLKNPQINHPEIVFNKNLIKKIEPVYNLTQGVSSQQLHRYAIYCLNLLPKIQTWHNLEQELGLPSINESLINIHDPINQQNIPTYIKRMALEELLINQFALKQVRKQNKVARPNISDIAKDIHDKITNNLGFEATEQQNIALSEIYQDQTSPNRMLRMLQGDVGSGKTFVALMSIVNVVKNGMQCCLMAPTELLSWQHFNFFNKALEQTYIKVAILTSSIKGKKRTVLLDQLQQGQIQILIGTHSIFQETIAFSNLGYVVIDEQHRFGVKQRLSLLNKAEAADLLLMSATPIPRSLNLVLYGDMDVSYVKSKPKNNLPIITKILADTKIDELTISLQNILNKNEQIYWICPLIEESEKKNFASVLKRHEALKKVYSNNVGLIHGGMPQDQKDQTMQDFKNGIIKLLVATTVIEVGIDVANATLIVIEDAQNFGLAQLHQLRGRVGRSHLQSYCMLIYNSSAFTITAQKRLKILKNSNDGFAIAEQDLILRGAGDDVGPKQSGLNSFVFSNLINDINLLELVQKFILQIDHQHPNQEVIGLFDKEHIIRDWIIV
jgi:ATP-dependent DNA helicase RecG